MEQGKCWNCRYFSRYYTKETTRFRATKFGRCCKAGEAVESNGGCERYMRRDRCKRSETMLRVCLGDILRQLKELRCILEEERETRDEDGK